MNSLATHIGNTDIYLIDQIVKDRYQAGERILDAGCREGRNLHWFYKQGFDIWGIDTAVEAIALIQTAYPKAASQFSVQDIAALQSKDEFFDHIICAAVLHFATDEVHFKQCFSELIRVLKTGGSLFIRMASTIGNPAHFTAIGNGRYLLADESERFLLTPTLLESLQQTHNFKLLEPIKTTNVHDLRYMTTLVIEK